jgi:5-formyltetrahydrofolate cyclo-ligase
MVTKAELRRQLRAARRALPDGQRVAESLAAAQLCLTLSRGLPASYAALPDELDLASLHERTWASRCSLFLPRVVGPGRLAWHPISGRDQLRPGAFGIAEPDPRLTAAFDLPLGTVVFVPGLAFTVDGRRLGQGGGFYDRLLAERPDLCAIGVGFSVQLVEDLPCEAHDARVSGLVIAGRLVLDPGLGRAQH